MIFVIYLVGFLVACALGGLFWILAIKSRKTYSCKTCGEVTENMEHMNAKRCNVCGSEFSQVS